MYMWTHLWPKRASLNAPRLFFDPSRWKREPLGMFFWRILQPPSVLLVHLQHLMTWQRLRGEKWDHMWYLVEFECTLGLDVFYFCVKMKVSLLKTKGDWKELSNISNCSIESKHHWNHYQTVEIYLPGCLLFVLIGQLLLCIYILCHFRNQRGNRKSIKGMTTTTNWPWFGFLYPVCWSPPGLWKMFSSGSL